MGRGRKGFCEQSQKKPKLKSYSSRPPILTVCGLRPNKPIRPLTPNEIKIAEQMTPQQLVNLLLGEGSDM